MTDEIRTPRLLLRRWRDEDREPFAAMGADPEVMRWFPAPLTREQSDALVDRIEAHLDEHGYGWWALEADGRFGGFTGIQWTTLTAPDASGDAEPVLDLGWRLPRWAWGHGWASEAGAAALARGLEATDTVVSVTALPNTRSRRVMERIGMVPEGEFDHPRVPAGSPLRRHVLYRARRDSWQPPSR